MVKGYPPPFGRPHCNFLFLFYMYNTVTIQFIITNTVQWGACTFSFFNRNFEENFFTPFIETKISFSTDDWKGVSIHRVCSAWVIVEITRLTDGITFGTRASARTLRATHPLTLVSLPVCKPSLRAPPFSFRRRPPEKHLRPRRCAALKPRSQDPAGPAPTSSSPRAGMLLPGAAAACSLVERRTGPRTRMKMRMVSRKICP